MADEKEKNGKVSGFFKNLGNKFNDATYDMRSDAEFDKTHPAYTVYTGSGALSYTANFHAEESLQDGYITGRTDDGKIACGHVLVNDVSGEAYYIAAVERTQLDFEFEQKTTQKPALKITLGEKAQKVEVIKAGDVFYLKK